MSNDNQNLSESGMGGSIQSDEWQQCPSGELTKMVHRLDASQRRSRNRQVLRTATMSTALFAGVVIALGSWMSARDASYGGISCSQCRDGMAEYHSSVAGEFKMADSAFATSMRTHLNQCTFCRSRFEALYPEPGTARTTLTRPKIMLALHPSSVFSLQDASY